MYAHKVVHVTMSGQMLGGAEEWQTGFYVGHTDADAEVPTQLFTDAVRDAWVTFFTFAGVNISSSYSFTQVKAARLNEIGKYDGTEPAVSFPATTILGPGSGSPLPPQLALVATLIAGSGKGLAGKGRMYLPGIKEQVDGGGHLSNTYTQVVATKLALFFDTINASTDIPGEVINASKGHGSPIIAGFGERNVPVNGVRVGNVFDTQRRRRNALAETYSVATVAD